MRLSIHLPDSPYQQRLTNNITRQAGFDGKGVFDAAFRD